MYLYVLNMYIQTFLTQIAAQNILSHNITIIFPFCKNGTITIATILPMAKLAKCDILVPTLGTNVKVEFIHKINKSIKWFQVPKYSSSYIPVQILTKTEHPYLKQTMFITSSLKVTFT